MSELGVRTHEQCWEVKFGSAPGDQARSSRSLLERAPGAEGPRAAKGPWDSGLPAFLALCTPLFPFWAGGSACVIETNKAEVPDTHEFKTGQRSGFC